MSFSLPVVDLSTDAAVASGVSYLLTPERTAGRVAATAGVTQTVGGYGKAWLFDSSTDYLTVSGTSLRRSYGLLFIAQIDSLPGGGATLLQMIGTSGLINQLEIYVNSSGLVRADVLYTNSPPYAYTIDTAAGSVTPGVPFVYYLDARPGRIRAWIDGKPSTISTGSPGTDSVTSYTVGGRTSTQDRFPGRIFAHAVVDPFQFDGQALTREPVRLFQPRRIPTLVIAGGGATGTSATTNAADTSSAAGTTTILGTSARTNARDTSSASGTTTIVGTSARTNAADTSTATGKTTIVGTSARTNAADTTSASGKTTVTGTSATTNARDTSAASGTVGGGAGVSGTSATTNANDTGAASGTTAVVGSSATTNGADTATASGTTSIVGTSATTNASDTATASGSAGAVSGTAAVTNADDTASGEGFTGNEPPAVEVVKRGGGSNFVKARKRLAVEYLIEYLTEEEPSEETKRVVAEIKAGRPVPQDAKPPAPGRSMSAAELADKIIPRRLLVYQSLMADVVEPQKVVQRAIRIAQERDDEDLLMLL
jgi:hypothetical protein